MSVRQMLSSLDSREISEWVAYFNLSDKPSGVPATLSDKIKTFFMTKRKTK